MPDDLEVHRRNLPHWRMDGSTYFITFRLIHGEFSSDECRLVLDHIVSGTNKFYTLLAAVVMPDHVHALLTPDKGFELSRIMKGIKGVSANLVNRRRASRGPLWQDESWDRIVRDQSELNEKLEYIVNNAAKAGIVKDPLSYEGLFVGEQVQ